jgi:transcriptional regulator with XRE-family HTH domain
MRNAKNDDIDHRIASRLKGLRAERGWSLEDLATRSGVSRATLSRLENAEVSATASVLGKLGTAYGLTVSRLMHLVEEGFAPLLKRADQPVWQDQASGFHRRAVSPPAQGLAGEVIEGTLRPGAEIVYETPPRPGLEHHLVLLEGALTLTIAGRINPLEPGDCLRYQLFGGNAFKAGKKGARYLIFMV